MTHNCPLAYYPQKQCELDKGQKELKASTGHGGEYSRLMRSERSDVTHASYITLDLVCQPLRICRNLECYYNWLLVSDSYTPKTMRAALQSSRCL